MNHFICIIFYLPALRSTILTQICLLTIMAHVGSYIPASFANIRLTDRLFTRAFLSAVKVNLDRDWHF